MFRTVGLLLIGGGIGAILGWILGFRVGEQEAEARHRFGRRYE